MRKIEPLIPATNEALKARHEKRMQEITAKERKTYFIAVLKKNTTTLSLLLVEDSDCLPPEIWHSYGPHVTSVAHITKNKNGILQMINKNFQTDYTFITIDPTI